jgi:putative MATE family efflux protein
MSESADEVAIAPPVPAAVDPASVVPATEARSTARHPYDRSIVEGPLGPAVWRIAWPTMLQNAIGGLQGIIDHVMVGHYVGYAGNAAIGVSWQIFLVVIVFVSSLFTGMNVLVARFAGAGDAERVNRTVYQAFLAAVVLSVGVLAPLGYVLAPSLLGVVNAAPDVRAQALPFLRIMFVFSVGMLIFFMLGGALRSAGDARTPLRLGIIVTVLNITFNVVLIRGLGPIPAFGTAGAAMGTSLAMGLIGAFALVTLARGTWVVRFPRGGSLRPEWTIIRSLFRFGLPAGTQAVLMNVAGVLLLAFIGALAYSAEAQAAYSVVYGELFSLVTWTAVGLLGAAATVAGQNLGAGQPERAARAVHAAAGIAIVSAGAVGLLFLVIPRVLLGVFGMTDEVVVDLGVQLMRYLSVSGIFIAVALTYTGGLQGTGDTRSPLFISIVSQIVVPLGLCWIIRHFGTLEAGDIWRAILFGHITRCVLTVLRFRQGHWRHITVDIDRRAASH